MKKTTFFSVLLLLFAMALVSCEKENNTANEAGLMTIEDLTTVEDLMLDAEDDLEELIENGLTNEDGIVVRNECPTRTVVPAGEAFPKTITIDYGDACTTPRDRVKSGQIIIELNAPRYEAGATRTVTFVNYFVDGVNLQGSNTLVNNGRDEDGNISFSRSFNHNIVYPDGDRATWEGSNTVTQIAGANTPRILADDVFLITGSTAGVNRDGKSYSSEIVTPLRKENRCRWISQGIRQVNRNGNAFTIDYGFGGGCDNRAEVTLPNGETRTIRIRAWWRR